MSKRRYIHVQELYPAIQAALDEGKSHREIAEQFGLGNKSAVKNLLYRERNKKLSGIPNQRGRKPAKTLAEYKYENERLKMENKLLRDFLQSTERM